MRYEILGPLRVVGEKGSSFVKAQKLAVVLGVLVIKSEQVVTAEQLMTEIWGEVPPQRASSGIHVYISRLRKFLHRPGQGSSPIVRRPGGYILHMMSDESDLRLFQKLAADGRRSAREGRHADAVDRFERAIDLWRGPLLDGLPAGSVVEGAAKWLTEMRIECSEMLVDSQFELGHHQEAVSRLSTLTAEHPLHETFHWQLMLALHNCDRRNDALRTYEAARVILDRELGLEPGEKLRELHHTVLMSG